MMNALLDALKFRHACKKFDPERKIPAEQLAAILECGRLSPSSFGMEPWRFQVIQNPELRARLRPACWGQAQITDSSDLVVILTNPQLVEPDSDYVLSMFQRRNLPADATAAYIERYRNHLESEIRPVMSYYAWCCKQCYIALANMLSAAAAAGIDSCPVEGFEKQAVEQVLGLEQGPLQVAVIFALGYRLGEQTSQLRLPAEQVISYR